jgi:hypothetical protein
MTVLAKAMWGSRACRWWMAALAAASAAGKASHAPAPRRSSQANSRATGRQTSRAPSAATPDSPKQPSICAKIASESHSHAYQG